MSKFSMSNSPIKNYDKTRQDKAKVEIFSKHLKNVFKPFSYALAAEEDNEIMDFLDIPRNKVSVKLINQTITKEVDIKHPPDIDQNLI